ncbi:hypothetical protein ACK3Z9_12205, partial [Aeromonas caviae]
ARETRAGAKRGCLKQLCATTILKNAATRLSIPGRDQIAGYRKNKRPRLATGPFVLFGGEGGIRTLEITH